MTDASRDEYSKLTEYTDLRAKVLSSGMHPKNLETYERNAKQPTVAGLTALYSSWTFLRR